MAILEKEPGLLEALKGEIVPKFLATRNPEGIPNVVPCVSILPADDQPDTLFFGNFLLRKSIRNLEADKRVAILVITPQLNGWILKADFIEFQRTGAYVERQMSGSLLRYNAYTGIRNAGVIHVTALIRSFHISKMEVALEYGLAKLRSFSRPKILQDPQPIILPLPVRHEFARMVAVKVLSWIEEDGYPLISPALSLQPAGKHAIVGWLGNKPSPPDGAQVATNILTFEAISYQAKGSWRKMGHAGEISVREVFAGGPPYPGGRVA